MRTNARTFWQARYDDFDIENRLTIVAVSGQTTTFIYDGDGNLVKKIKPDGSKTLYIDRIYEVDKTSGGTVTQTRTFYPAGSAMRVGGTRYYILKDQLNSASVVTNQSGTTVGEDRFYPFGETRFTTGNMQTDKLFTGQRDTGLGIYNYGARFYSQKLGRFLSADTILTNPYNPQNLNHYSYVRNNPLRYIDPTGRMVTDGGDGGVGCAITHSCLPPPCSTCGGNNGGGSGNGSGSGSGGSGSGGAGDGGGHSSGGADPLKYVLSDLYNNPIFAGGQSGDGCNTWLLWNGSNFCHHTTYTSQPICIPVSLCSSSNDEWMYATRFQYPGQWPGNPVAGLGEERHVVGGDFIPWKWLQDKGAITVTIDGNKIINTTMKSHIFYQGDIERTISNGWVTTEGHGTNSSIVIAAFNQYGGPVAFEGWDFLMTSFSTLDKLSGGAMLNLVNSIP